MLRIDQSLITAVIGFLAYIGTCILYLLTLGFLIDPLEKQYFPILNFYPTDLFLPLVASIACGYCVTWYSKQKTYLAAIMVGILILVIEYRLSIWIEKSAAWAKFFQESEYEKAPEWLNWTVTLLAIPFHLIGAWIFKKRSAAKIGCYE